MRYLLAKSSVLRRHVGAADPVDEPGGSLALQLDRAAAGGALARLGLVRHVVHLKT